jgi:flagellar L-ring protein precursor FlgH
MNMHDIRVRSLVFFFAALWFCSANSYAQSLYNEASYEALTSDSKSFAIGQSITVLIYEQASAATTAETDTNSSNAVSATATIDDRTQGGAVGFDNRFEGGGTITRTGKLMASVTVTIVGMTEGGELLVEGGQDIMLNNETQNIHLSGRVRPEDISAENTVISNRVADAVITYKGEGLLGERQKPGFLTRFFNWIF